MLSPYGLHRTRILVLGRAADEHVAAVDPAVAVAGTCPRPTLPDTVSQTLSIAWRALKKMQRNLGVLQFLSSTGQESPRPPKGNDRALTMAQPMARLAQIPLYGRQAIDFEAPTRQDGRTRV